ncbi:MAG: hypothetical protein NVS1B1_02290 [Candidatus Limnocylindrales bacterium]
MRITRCPRCRAEDIAADAHPTRVLRGLESLPFFVCRNCYRAAELQYRIACEAGGVPYVPMPVWEGLRLLRDFYLDRYEEWQDPALLLEDAERRAATDPIRRALEEVQRRLVIGPAG